MSFRKTVGFYDFENTFNKLSLMNGQFLIASGSRKANINDDKNEKTTTRNTKI